jgi:thiol-disulfide isomerase/thioredoxin
MSENKQSEISQIREVKSAEEFNKIVEKSKAVLVIYYTSWCSPCKQLGEDLKEWLDKENKYPNITVVKIMIDDKSIKDIGKDVVGVPLIRYYKNGQRTEFPHVLKGQPCKFKELEGYHKTRTVACLDWLNK